MFYMLCILFLFSGISPSKSKCDITDVDSFVLLSDGPAKDCNEEDVVNAFGIPSFAELNRALGIQSPSNVCNYTPVHAHGKSPMEDTNSFRDLSPLVPIRLSQYFRNELGDVQCSQYVADRYLKSFNSPNDEDCIVMVNVDHSDYSKPTNHVNLCSPDVILQTTPKAVVKLNEAVVDVHKIGSSNFAARCQELSRSNDVTYNKLHSFTAPATSYRNPVKVANSPELEILSDTPIVSSAHLSKVPACSKGAPSFQPLGGSTTRSSAAHVPRRIVVPGRFNSDPYVPQGNRYSVTAQERRNHLAMVQIASHPEWCKYEAIRYERAYCSYSNLSSLQFKSRVDNFLILCVCRYLFNEAHPSVSKKHFFFSYIGETILDGTNAEIVGNAFNGANSAFPMWRSNMLYFPICRFSHWFSFVVCLKEKLFVFLDSLYGEFSDFHLAIRDPIVNNFINLWDTYVTPILRKRIDFQNFDIVYPAVPQQNNTYDCGVFSVMYMKHWSPRTPIGNLFTQADIDNIRIKLANELYFSHFNTTDKSLVTNFFGDVSVVSDFFICFALVMR
ncbi:uncharacterized protein [Triticum aestivum]|uniref:uncharacterized protein n=1 Tax=Triticum aestivum TaxID=4565 RepID=UPI001D01D17E|nr:uncharacterized protein LOC123153660 [Triticum aestivum]